ncbi:ADP-ribose pyrophosphatase [Proteiniborus ethanoligenes]|uniref:ADP-ribose pyrophosphatase n=1 Tax=Proteiniborus ethanoligenes TaxID=415015 RepID=A0A1H3KBP5_9FIRM|nr:NUDIX hydrolase [Proteiniborus ethanoligenes]SDY49018.1 ADP-ribose pyrophosphatase [Proteiniborus ethanoligenes]
MIYEEKTMKSEKIYEGKILTVKVDTVELPDKKYSKREIVELSGAVAIVPITDNGDIIFVKQFRKATESVILEIPAGKLEINEEPLDCALRELKEETGYSAENMEYLFKYYTSPGFTNEVMHLFLATGIIYGEATPEDDEYIDVVRININEALEMIKNGEIKDGKTIIGILMAYEKLKFNEKE